MRKEIKQKFEIEDLKINAKKTNVEIPFTHLIKEIADEAECYKVDVVFYAVLNFLNMWGKDVPRISKEDIIRIHKDMTKQKNDNYSLREEFEILKMQLKIITEQLTNKEQSNDNILN
jgi:CRISPR/Cas system-associated protein Cas10 (large subunit of type III CRISPR-Cas system)